MHKFCLKLTSFIAVSVAYFSCWHDGRFVHGYQDQTNLGERLFRTIVQPVLINKCAACHNVESASGGLNLQSRITLLKGGVHGPTVLPNHSAQSPLLHALEGKHGFKQMPPGKPLDDVTIGAFRQWIDAGAPWIEDNASVAGEKNTDDSLWAFAPLKSVNPPLLTGSRIQTVVDNFILARLQEQKLVPAPAADRVTLLRRATFDLHGLPPTPEEVAAFVNDPQPTPQAFAKIVERLLDSPRYGERWGRHWLDVVRYADTAGGSNDFERPNAWRYRDYVIRSFQQDKPYDQFIREQLAGDELDDRNAENLVATGFLRMGPWEHTAMSVEAVTRQEWLDDITHQTGVTFLAMTMNCAKCHDHKFDPIPTKDYYSLQAAFATTYFQDQPAPFLPQENYQPAAATMPQWQARIAKNNQLLSHTLAVIAAKKKDDAQVKRLGSNPDDIEALERERAYRKRQELYRLASLRATPQAFSVRSGLNKEGKLEETHVLVGGTLGAQGAKVTPAAPSAPVKFAPEFGELASLALPVSSTGRRLALAQWIAHPANPLTARVMVNRIWQWHFGNGLVETANNFGKMGKRPTHPEMLDWLAQKFVQKGWSIKAMHRLLMNSAAYQRASLPRDLNPEQVEKASRWLAHFPPRRLEAEELRDAMLAVAGELNLAPSGLGGVGGFPELNADLIAQPRLIMGTVAPAWQASPTRAERNRRTVYTFQQRGLLDPFIEVFNGANPNESCERRRASTVSPQVFSLLNSRFSHETALAFAQRLERTTPSLRQQIKRAFQLAWQRHPSAQELQQALAHVAAMTKHHTLTKPPALPELKPVVLSVTSEFSGQTIQFTDDVDFTGYERHIHPSQVASSTRALAELCLVLLNANEFVYVY